MLDEVLKTVITVLVTAVVTGSITYAKSTKGKIKALSNGILSLLRAELIRNHEKYTAREYCPIYAKDAIEKAYNAYHTLGGNGTITGLYNEIMKLPDKERKED